MTWAADHDQRAALINQLLAHYGRDGEFRAALDALAARLGSPAGRRWLARQVAAAADRDADGFPVRVDLPGRVVAKFDLNALAAGYGLGRIRPDDPDRPGWPSGRNPAVNAIADWALHRVDDPFVAFPMTVPPTPVAFGPSGEVPTISLPVRWDPQAEPRSQARDRLRGEVDRVLGLIEAMATKDGLESPGLHPAEARHVEWLFLRLRHGLSWAKIGSRVGESWDAVRHGAKDVADRMGVDI